MKFYFIVIIYFSSEIVFLTVSMFFVSLFCSEKEKKTDNYIYDKNMKNEKFKIIYGIHGNVL